MESQTKNKERNYKYSEVCTFRKTKDLFGGLSNMAPGFPIRINGNIILTSEALYQACRFPHLPDLQQKIISEKSPMTAKMVSKPFRNDSRPDWDNFRKEIMYWCLKVKLAQNFLGFGQLLEKTFDKPIVEDSRKDAFWGAIQDKNNPGELNGVNALGRLLMKLRQEYNSHNRFDLLFVKPPGIPDFFLFEEQIQPVDERQSFVEGLYKIWKLTPLWQSNDIVFNHLATAVKPYLNGSDMISTVSEPLITEEKKNRPKKGKTKSGKGIQPKLPL